ncbi:sigma-54-dependent transcriptional regulator [Wenzhouxiangella marina]|uniref:Chemotaxis protein CheY n=1 Tax=Wenzhouxiangella marina TaxID=1579979 RepID=A0A0K0XS57_9GAMM|nr:sigma-54 dependent transcriptional regulator [Wenzhouxiangella marina]AKS40523.1 chemotaxis protein CheY [Wenzhouxiangella marina]MBB6088153.1 DNA-binding NtrC family response regulator [Wenzhouxiangella marina]
MTETHRQDPARLLIVDDQRDVLEALRLLFKPEGFRVDPVQSPAAALEALEQGDFQAVLADLNYTRDTTSGDEGLDLVQRIHALDPELPVIVMTAWASVDVAVEAMRRGARDFVEKPWDNRRLLSIVRNQIELSHALKRSRHLAAENDLLKSEDPDFIAESPAMREVVDLVRRVAPADVAVLITGEAGTGKGMVARLLHRHSERSDHPMISVNMGSVPEAVYESEMFGHVRGAFTDASADRTGRFELADRGTLFLDEIGNVPVSQQAKLLRVLETGEYEPVGSSKTRTADVRLISATNADLSALCETGEFRKDLFFRINTVEIPLPALRDRREDILPLARQALSRLAKRYRAGPVELDRDAAEALQRYDWPGNVRELQHVIERAVLLARGERIGAADLRLSPTSQRSGGNASLSGMTLDDAERLLIRQALERSDGNVNQAAEALGISRSALYRRIEKHDLAD